MSRSRKIFIGFLSFLPLILCCIYLALFMSMFFTMFRYQQEDPDPAFMFANLYPVIAIAILMGLSSLALLVYFIIHVVNNKQIDSTERVVWILILIFAGMIGFPIYWYMRIWKQPDLTPTGPGVLQ